MHKNFLFLLSVFVSFSGCAAINQPADSELKKEIAQLQVANKNLEQKQLDLYSKYDSSLATIETMHANVTELSRQVSSLKQKIQDMEFVQKKSDGNDNTVKAVVQEAPVQALPSDAYKNAYNDFLVGKYELAEMGFKSFIKKYPEHELAVQAQYYVGECLYSRSKWADAYEEYKKVEDVYKNSEFVSSARLKMALCLELLGKKNETVIILKSILQDFPKSAEAFTAKEKLKVYTK